MNRKPALHALVAGVAGLGERRDVGEAPGQRFARRLMVVIILTNVVAGSSIWLFGAQVVARHASTDLMARLSAIQSLIQRGDLLDTTHLSLIQAQISPAMADLNRLEGTLPLDGLVGTSSVSVLNRSMVVATDFLAAVNSLVHASLAVQPSLTALLVSAVGATPQQAGNGTLLPYNTNSALDMVSMDVRNAQASWQAAQSEIQALGESTAEDVLGTSALNINMITQYMRSNSSQLADLFATSTAFLNALPTLLGISQPERYLVLYLDPNQLLPTGGVATSFAALEVAGGAVDSGIHFHSVLTLDCAHGCVSHGLDERDVNPDFVSRADHAIAAMLSEAHVNVHNVIAVTPDLVGDILTILGPVHVPELGLTISAGNLRSESASYDARIVSSAQYSDGTPTDTSVFANAVMSTIMRALAGASHDQLLRIGGALVRALTTKHLLIFTSYYPLEQQLTALSIGGRVNSTTTLDTLYVADADLGGDYNSSSISETISDRITLNRSGTAAHALSISYYYAYPVSSAQALSASPYHDLVQVMVPVFAAKLVNNGSCATNAPVSLPYNQMIACKLTVNPGETVTVHMSWTVPLPQAAVDGRYYEIQIERQPGAQVAMTIAIAPATGLSLRPAEADERMVKGLVEWSTSPLQEDSLLKFKYSSTS